MNYYVTALALRLASANALTKSAYWTLSKMKRGPRSVWHDRGTWLLENLPDSPSRILELGTGWVHAYSLYQILVRDDEVHCFDVMDRRNFNSFVATIPAVCKQIQQMQLAPDILERVRQRAAIIAQCKDFDEVYERLNIKCQISEDGIPNYPENYFDAITSIDVLEHVETRLFRTAAEGWYKIMKPGGRFLAQVGIADHISVYDGNRQPKRYLKHSHRTWDLLLNNDVQYCNRMTATEMIGILKDVGFEMDQVDIELCNISREEVHADYQWQSDEDMRAVRADIRAHK
jgi:predicted SAM-dependent methyltransferase